MKYVNQKQQHGWGKRAHGWLKHGIVSVGVAAFLTLSSPAAHAISQLEYLQWMVQLTGDSASFSAESSGADYVQWARAKGMDPSGGWNPNSALTSDQLAQSLVQLYGLNSRKYGGDNYKTLTREGINITPGSPEVSRSALAGLVDDFGFQSRTAVIAKSKNTKHKPKTPKPPKPPKPPKVKKVKPIKVKHSKP
jgi:hypothetical protein